MQTFYETGFGLEGRHGGIDGERKDAEDGGVGEGGRLIFLAWFGESRVREGGKVFPSSVDCGSSLREMLELTCEST